MYHIFTFTFLFSVPQQVAQPEPSVNYLAYAEQIQRVFVRTQNKYRLNIRQEANNEIKKSKRKNKKSKRDAEIQKDFLEEQRLKPTIDRKCIRPKQEPQEVQPA